jgi:hypothetical protein
VLPVLGPVIFLTMPTHLHREEEEEELILDEDALNEAALIEAAQTAQVAPKPPPQAAAQAGPTPPTVFQRGQFTFNRRFFETKLVSFTRSTPDEKDKDMVLCVESARGNHIAQRIAKILPNDVALLVAKGGATAEVVIPFNEIKEIQIRHKDA